MKVMFVLIVHKKEVPAGSNPPHPRPKDIQSQRKTTTSFTGKESRVRKTLLKRLGTCIDSELLCDILCDCVRLSQCRVWIQSVLSCVASFCRQLLRMTGSGWASVLNTQSSRGRRSSSEKIRYRYLSVSERKKLCCMLSWLTVVV